MWSWLTDSGLCKIVEEEHEETPNKYVPCVTPATAKTFSQRGRDLAGGRDCPFYNGHNEEWDDEGDHNKHGDGDGVAAVGHPDGGVVT